jgi:hypothetical protein
MIQISKPELRIMDQNSCPSARRLGKYPAEKEPERGTLLQSVSLPGSESGRAVL